MGLSYTTVQRLFVGSFIASAITWFTQDNYTDAALVLIALSALIGIAWGLSEREMTFEHLGRNQAGVLTILAFFASIALFAEVGIRVWGFPTTGSYVLSLFFVGSFWWTSALIQPKNN
ncbi:hypothetical protein OAC38_02100 [Candidatus Poseidoniaceae archaeon]|nr:hypothetical protein [Candidatus Poseidoniaceae archaeon]